MIKVDFTPSKKEYFKISVKKIPSNKTFWIILLILLLINFLPTIPAIFNTFSKDSINFILITTFIAYVLITIFIGVIFLVIVLIFNAWTIYRSNGVYNVEYKYIFDKDKITSENKFLKSIIYWNYVSKLTEDKNYLYIKTINPVGKFIVIPKKAFNKKEDISKLKELVKNKIG